MGGAQQMAASVVDSATGAYMESHTLTSYDSLGGSRAITLTYDSLRANPQQIVRLPFTGALIGGFKDVRERFVAQFWIDDGNFRHDLPGYVNAAGVDTGLNYWKFSTSEGEAVALLDMRDFASGYYDLGVRDGIMVTGVDGAVFGTQQTFGMKLLNINSVDSMFGAGWGMNGFKQIVENGDGSVLIIDGNGTQEYFGAPTTPGGAYVGHESDFSTLIKRNDGTFLRTMKDQSQYSFNQFNMLSSLTDTNGNSTSFQYDSAGKLISMTDPVGLQTTFNYTGDRINTIVDPFGRTTTLVHDADGNLTGITDAYSSETDTSFRAKWPSCKEVHCGAVGTK